MVKRWAVEFHSVNQLDGETRRFQWDGTQPYLFRTRREALLFIKEKWGYIATRPDLRAEPHGWRMPKAVHVEVKLCRV